VEKIYRYLCTHTLCIYMLSCSGVTGAVKEAIETLQGSGATAFVLDIRNNRSVSVNALKHKSRSEMCLDTLILYCLSLLEFALYLCCLEVRRQLMKCNFGCHSLFIVVRRVES